MKSLKRIGLIISACMLFISAGCNNVNSTKVVKVENKDGKFRLTVNGDEFFVKGAGCEYGNIDALAEAGANSFRTWRTENGVNTGDEVLNSAQKNGLLVLMGLEMKSERQGFDYNDTVAVKKQFDEIKLQIEKYKKHPALLGWVVGNELNLFYKNPAVWNAVNDIILYIHKNDPNHPATTTLAGISKDVVDEIKKRATALDFLSIQMYGDIVNLQQRIKDAQWAGPYIVTEWGATGHWEVPVTAWGAPVEQTSTEKAEAFALRYQKAILSDSVNCLGSYVFLWGQKQERTPTWYGMFTTSDDKTETVDVMYKIWKGVAPANSCPSIKEITLNSKSRYDNITLAPGSEIKATISSIDINNDTLEYNYEILHETKDAQTGGDKEEVPPTVLSVKQPEASLNTTAPVEEGAYRLYFYVRDSFGHSATANIPFLVKK